jgi:hypothetical protein
LTPLIIFYSCATGQTLDTTLARFAPSPRLRGEGWGEEYATVEIFHQAKELPPILESPCLRFFYMQPQL